ncbi:MAG: FtsK/SpoIIIE domain-containing protein, partial [Planctomycetota bacterium]
MNDSSVAPAGLFSPDRQRRLLDALIARFKVCSRERESLLRRHEEERLAEESGLMGQRDEVTAECRKRRRETLMQWDTAEEKIFSEYEERTVQLRHDLNRLASLFRKKLAEGQKTIERKVEARREAVIHQYESRKDQPGIQSRKEIEQIKTSLEPLHAHLAEARELTIRRLDRLPNVPPAESPEDEIDEPPPETVQQTVDSVARLSRKCRSLIDEMHAGAAAKFVDSFYLPAGVAVAVVIWSLGVIIAQPAALWLYLVSGVVVAGLIGFTIFAALSIPLRRQTRRLYPRVHRLGEATEQAAAIGKKISADQAKATAKELIERRDQHLRSASAWQQDQLSALETRLAQEEQQAKDKLTSELDQLGDRFRSTWSDVSTSMHEEAETVAASITDQLGVKDRELNEHRQANADRRRSELERVSGRIRDGLKVGFDRVERTREMEYMRFPSWEKLIASEFTSQSNLDFAALGQLHIRSLLSEQLQHDSEGQDSEGAHSVGQDSVGRNGKGVHLSNGADESSTAIESVAPVFTEEQIPPTLPIALHRRLHSGVIIRCAPEKRQQAVEMVHAALWRMLANTAGGRTRLTLIDPVGRGQNFTPFLALADHDPALIGHRVWTTETQIESRLGELAQHAEDVLQASLRDQFERVEDYNQIAGSMAEPYQAIAAVGFPEGLTRSGHKHLRALIESGIRCGLFVFLVCDEDQAWPNDLPRPQDQRMLEIVCDAGGRWYVDHPGLEQLDFTPATNLPAEMRSDMVDKIGTAATQAARVEIPLPTILPEVGGQGSTDEGIDITIGSQGGKRTLALQLGEGVRQHVLIAGKTGSGKSTLLHSIITSGAHQYTPNELQFFLLDFKKGVEFKSYADVSLPHARVIGIESEREFGRSVLQRLDEELQTRGERFRSASSQEI